jgi:hypothetical protein
MLANKVNTKMQEHNQTNVVAKGRTRNATQTKLDGSKSLSFFRGGSNSISQSTNEGFKALNASSNLLKVDLL